MINLKMEQRRDFHNVLLDTLSLLVFVCVCVCVCEHLDEGAGAKVGLFSADSSDPPTSSGPL